MWAADDGVIRAALFIDFDNVYSSLAKTNENAANRFAQDPRRWTTWFERGSHDDTAIGEDEAQPRRLIVRRCYLNPARYGNARAAFTRSGFSVIDCPSLTSQGKSSADIYMVMDIMDALNHRTVIEEFIILSSDADFTPVLLRLREHDRRSTIIANAVAAAALKAASDIAVDQNEFIEEALRVQESSIHNVSRDVVGSSLPVGAGVVQSEHRATKYTLSSQRKSSVVKFLRDKLDQSTKPVLLGPLGNEIVKSVGADIQEHGWSGYGTLTQLLRSIAEEVGFQLVASGAKSFIYDPRRHSPIPFEEMDHLSGIQAPLAQFIDRMSKSLSIPRFSPPIYHRIFEAMANASGDHTGDQLTLGVKIVDLCGAKGINISRKTVDFILTGLADVGLDLFEKLRSPDEIAGKFKENVINLSYNAQINFSDEEKVMIDEWLTPTLPPAR